MKTVKDIKNTIKKEELVDEDGILSEKQMMNFVLSMKIKKMISDNSTPSRLRQETGRGVIDFQEEIKNENVIELFRDLYKTTRNNFVKSVLVTVGKTRKFTSNQIVVITDEIARHENLIINF